MTNRNREIIDDTLARTMNASVDSKAVKETAKKTRKSTYYTDKDKLAFIKESYKALRTNLFLSLPQGKCHKIIISSSILGEGKSTTTANLATSLAQTDKKVLLIDADLRKPSIYGIMGFSNTPGFTNVLTGLSTLEEAINKTSFPNLDVLCAGISVPNPGEILAWESTAKFIQSLEENYDYILFDSPPINVVADALPLITMSDGVVLVVRQNYSSYPEIDSVKQSIEFIGGKILGFVLNGIEDDVISKRKYGKYGKYYRQ